MTSAIGEVFAYGDAPYDGDMSGIAPKRLHYRGRRVLMSCVRSNELLYRALEVKHPPGTIRNHVCNGRTQTFRFARAHRCLRRVQLY